MIRIRIRIRIKKYSPKVKLTAALLLSSFVQTSAFATLDSANTLPSNIQSTLQTVYQEYKGLQGGKNADYIPELAKVNPDYLGIAVITIDGKVYSAGDADVPFAIESVSKPFVYALALEDNGEKKMVEKVGLNATGKAFNSIMAIEEMPNHIENPLVNAGAIEVTSLIKGKNSEDKWNRVLSFIQSLSDGKPYLGQPVYQSESATNQHNRAIGELLDSYGLMFSEPMDAVDRYTKACSIMVTAKQLALMGATLANGGVNPISHQRIISARYVKDTLSEMTVSGLYENSGAWWFKVGLPSKSGVGGGIMSVVPNKMAIVVFSPPLDSAGNSVRAQAVIEKLADTWHLHLLNTQVTAKSM